MSARFTLPPCPTTREWYERHDCTHAHCPYDCEHPQPILDGGELLCLRCLTFDGRRTLMIPCTPQICERAA